LKWTEQWTAVDHMTRMILSRRIRETERGTSNRTVEGAAVQSVEGRDETRDCGGRVCWWSADDATKDRRRHTVDRINTD